MGGRSMKWEQKSVNDHVREATRAAHDQLAQADVSTKCLQNQVDREWIASLLSNEHAKKLTRWESMERQLLVSHEWLVENPEFPLHHVYRHKYEAYARIIRLVELGKIDPTVNEFDDAAKARFAERMRRERIARQAGAARKREVEASKPDWMRDPSLLPKRPPGVK